MKKIEKTLKPRDLIAKDLLTPKYRMRVVASEKVYKRVKQKQNLRKELAYV